MTYTSKQMSSWSFVVIVRHAMVLRKISGKHYLPQNCILQHIGSLNSLIPWKSVHGTAAEDLAISSLSITSPKNVWYSTYVTIFSGFVQVICCNSVLCIKALAQEGLQTVLVKDNKNENMVKKETLMFQKKRHW